MSTHVQNKFSVAFSTYVSSIDPKDVSEWLNQLECAERTKKNVRDCLAHFFKWCRGQGYLPRDSDIMEGVQDYRKRRRGAVTIMPADDLGRLMAEAAENYRVTVPYLALRAFAGLRNSEATQIDWKDIDLTDSPDENGNFGWITVTDEVAKQTDDDDGVRRLVPVRDVLREWLLPHVKRVGRVSPFGNMQKQLTAVARAAKVTCKRNALRHSFISYSVALSADIARVATESGNTSDVIRKHYLRVVKPDLAKLWFEVKPQRPDNVTPMPSGQLSRNDPTSRQCPLGETGLPPVSRSQS